MTAVFYTHVEFQSFVKVLEYYLFVDYKKEKFLENCAS